MSAILNPQTGQPFAARFVEAAGVSIDPDEDQWRPLTGDGRRDLTPMTQRRMQDLSVYLWQTNPLANRLVELPVAYLLADGVQLQSAAEDPEMNAIVQEWLDRYWLHPINNWPIKIAKKVRELAVFGEQCWPTFVNEFSGEVRLGYLDPSLIETVVMDPDNAEQPIGIVTCRSAKGQQRRYRVIVNGPEEELFTTRTRQIRATFTDGECFYYTINNLCVERRGRSDLLPLMDWCDAYESAMFGEVDRAQSMRAYFWDVMLKGATETEVKNRASQIVPPAPGTVRVHNDSEEWTAVTPDLKATDGAASARLFRNHITGVFPEHWFGGAENVNRAVGDSMSEPAFKLMSLRQSLIGFMLEEGGRYVIRQRERAATGREPDLFLPEYRVRAKWPEMVVRDTTKYAAALQQVVVSCQLALDRNLLSMETALNLIDSISGRLGVPIDAERELAQAGRQAQARAEQDAYPPPEL